MNFLGKSIKKDKKTLYNFNIFYIDESVEFTRKKEEK